MSTPTRWREPLRDEPQPAAGELRLRAAQTAGPEHQARRETLRSDRMARIVLATALAIIVAVILASSL